MIPAHHEAVNMMAMLYVRNCMTRRCDRSPLFVILHQMVELELRRRLQAFTLLCGVCIATRQTRQSGVDPSQLLLKCESGSLDWLSFSHNIDDARYFCLICAPHYDEKTTFGRRSFAPDARVHKWPIKATGCVRLEMRGEGQVGVEIALHVIYSMIEDLSRSLPYQNDR